MSRVFLPRGFDNRYEFCGLSLAELGLLARAYVFASRTLSDGFVSFEALKKIAAGRPRKLLASILKNLSGCGALSFCDGGIQLTEYLDENPSREQVLSNLGKKRDRRIAPSLRSAVIGRDGFTCHLCGGAVPTTDVHLDHVIPFSRGGATTFDNLRVSHSRCNLTKSNKWDGAHHA